MPVERADRCHCKRGDGVWQGRCHDRCRPGAHRRVRCDDAHGDDIGAPERQLRCATPAWSQDPPAPPSFLCGNIIKPYDGTASACLGGVGRHYADAQPDHRPSRSARRSLTLNGQKCIATQETNPADIDVVAFDVVVGDVVIAPLGKLSNQQGTVMCQFGAFTLQSPLTNDPASATLRIRSTLDNNNTTSFYLDALTLTAGCVP